MSNADMQEFGGLALRDAWNEHRKWTQIADRMRDRITTWRKYVLYMMVTGAALETLATQIPMGWIPALIGAVVLAMAPFFSSRFLTAKAIRNWTRARSASEGYKSLVYMYSAGGAPYHDPAKRDDELNKAIPTIGDAMGDLSNDLAQTEPDGKPLPGRLSNAAYVEKRVRGQVKSYYEVKARELAIEAKWLRQAELALSCLAALIAALVAGAQAIPEGVNPIGVVGWFRDNIGAWIAVLTTASGALLAHLASSRLDEQVTNYLATARQLRALARTGEGIPAGDAKWPEFVKTCEETISTQNRAWMAVLTEESGQPQG